MVFGKKSTFSHVHFFGKSSHQRSFFDILDRKECFLDRNSEVWKKCKKSKICKGVSPWFLSKNGRFFHSGFLGKSSHKRLFFDILNRKEYFLDRNSEVWKRCKKSKICKGVSPYLLSKNRPFPHMRCFGKSSHKRSFFDSLDRKECILDQNINVWKKSKKSKICKGVSPRFLSKIDVFLMCVFLENLATKDRFLIFEIEKNAF